MSMSALAWRVHSTMSPVSSTVINVYAPWTWQAMRPNGAVVAVVVADVEAVDVTVLDTVEEAVDTALVDCEEVADVVTVVVWVLLAVVDTVLVADELTDVLAVELADVPAVELAEELADVEAVVDTVVVTVVWSQKKVSPCKYCLMPALRALMRVVQLELVGMCTNPSRVQAKFPASVTGPLSPSNALAIPAAIMLHCDRLAKKRTLLLSLDRHVAAGTCNPWQAVKKP